MYKKEIIESTLLKKITFQDTLFHGDYTLDPYQNCAFDCFYCDSTYEKIIYIKQNAMELLKNEIKNKEKKRIIIGSVHDPYQPVEKEYQLTRNILTILKKQNQPIHILTKSSLILRDLDLLTQFEDVMVTLTILSMNPTLAELFESKAPSPKKRVETIQTLNNHSIFTGCAVIPLIPFITDTKKELQSLIKTAAQYNTSYLLFKYLQLKGDQKTMMFHRIQQHFPQKYTQFISLYSSDFNPSNTYQEKNLRKIKHIADSYQIPTEIKKK